MAGVERVFVDGSNLLFALGRRLVREQDGGPPIPPAAVIGRLRAAFPATVSVELVFDGRPAGGVAGRLASGLRVSYSGRETADRLIDEGVLAQLNADGPAGTWGILVVTDDRGLRNLVQSKGARVAGTAWLARRIGQAVEGPPTRLRSGSTGSGGNLRRTGSGAIRDRGAGHDPADRGGPSGRRGPGGRREPGAPGPKAGTTIGHRRPPRAPDRPDRDER